MVHEVSQQVESELGSGLTEWVEAKQNGANTVKDKEILV